MIPIVENTFIWIYLLAWLPICASQTQTTKILLRVGAGTGVSFIDLWNLNGYSVGTSSSSIHRSGTIDNPYFVNCPQKYYVDIDDYTITYDGVLTTNLTSWIVETPFSIENSVSPLDVTLETSSSGVIFKLLNKVAPTNLYLAVDFTGQAPPYPKYYYVSGVSPETGPIPGNEANFQTGTVLQIKGRYDTSCDIGDHSISITESHALGLLQGLTTTEEQTTESTTMSTTTESETSPSGTTPQAMCPCDCDFKQRLDTLSAVSDIPIEELRVQLAPVIQEIKENLTVDASKLSTTIRKKQSASDERESAEQVGVIGAVLLGFTFGLLILIDISSMQRHLMLAKQNCLYKQEEK